MHSTRIQQLKQTKMHFTIVTAHAGTSQPETGLKLHSPSKFTISAAQTEEKTAKKIAGIVFYFQFSLLHISESHPITEPRIELLPTGMGHTDSVADRFVRDLDLVVGGVDRARRTRLV